MNIDQLYILLVEPSTTQQRIIGDWLRGFGVRHLDIVTDGEPAITSLHAQRPDVVISAMHLPGMTGTDLLQRIRSEDRFQDVGFILISSETQFRYLEPLRQAGIIAILPKPFDEQQLRCSLLATLDYLEPNTLNLAHFTPDELRVLLVDDMSTGRRFMRQILEKMGVEQIQEAGNGREARELIDREFFDLIISDYYMPEMDGQALVDYIRQESNQPGVPVLMVTSRTDEGRIAALQQSGVSAVFDKPFNVDTLRAMIENVLT